MSTAYKVFNIVIAVAFILVIIRLIHSSYSIEKNKQNVKALTDTVRIYKDKNGELYYQKSMLQSSYSELERLNKDLYEQISVFKRSVRKDIETAVSTTIEASGEVFDTVFFTVDRDTSFIQNFADSLLNADIHIGVTNGLVSVGDFRYDIHVPLSIFVTNDKEVIVKSKYNNVRVNSIDAWVSDDLVKKTRKKWFGLGASVGFGAGYDVLHKQAFVGAYVGIGLNFNLISF